MIVRDARPSDGLISYVYCRNVILVTHNIWKQIIEQPQQQSEMDGKKNEKIAFWINYWNSYGELENNKGPIKAHTHNHGNSARDRDMKQLTRRGNHHRLWLWVRTFVACACFTCFILFSLFVAIHALVFVEPKSSMCLCSLGLAERRFMCTVYMYILSLDG